MIDLRCHILDGTGCGPDSFAESLEMCRAAAEGGVRTLVATPRWRAGDCEPPLPFGVMKDKIARLQAETRGTLSIKSGFVFDFTPALPELYDRHGASLTLGGGQHLLVSLPSTSMPAETEKVWESLARRGVFVLLGHPECSPALRRDPAPLARWAAAGVKFQIDAASVAGTHGREVQKFATDCLRRFESGAVVASNTRGGRMNPLGRMRAELTSRLGSRLALKCLTETPTAILGNGHAADIHPKGDRKAASAGLSSLLRSMGPIKAMVD